MTVRFVNADMAIRARDASSKMRFFVGTIPLECEECAGTGRYGFRDDDGCVRCFGSGWVPECTWWVFELPHAIAYVPASGEKAARDALVRDCYKGAPVHEWPLLGTLHASREALTRALLDQAEVGCESSS